MPLPATADLQLAQQLQPGGHDAVGSDGSAAAAAVLEASASTGAWAQQGDGAALAGTSAEGAVSPGASETQEAGAEQQALRRVSAWHARRALRSALHGWAEAADGRRVARRKAARAVTWMQRRQLYKAYQSWCDFTGWRAERWALSQRAARHLRLHQLGCAWAGWLARVGEARRGRAVMRKVVRRTRARAFDAWLTLAAYRTMKRYEQLEAKEGDLREQDDPRLGRLLELRGRFLGKEGEDGCGSASAPASPSEAGQGEDGHGEGGVGAAGGGGTGAGQGRDGGSDGVQ